MRPESGLQLFECIYAKTAFQLGGKAKKLTHFTEYVIFYERGNLLSFQSKINGKGIQQCHCIVFQHLVKDRCLHADLMKRTIHKAGKAGSSTTNGTTCNLNENQCLSSKTMRLEVLRFRIGLEHEREEW